MADYGFRISYVGNDVKTCDDKDCVLTSKYSNLKGALSGGGTVMIDESGEPYSTTVTVAHNLGYKPVVRLLADAYRIGKYYNCPFVDNGDLYDGSFQIRTDNTNAYFDFYWNQYDTHDPIYIPYKYFIFLDKAVL